MTGSFASLLVNGETDAIPTIPSVIDHWLPLKTLLVSNRTLTLVPTTGMIWLAPLNPYGSTFEDVLSKGFESNVAGIILRAFDRAGATHLYGDGLAWRAPRVPCAEMSSDHWETLAAQLDGDNVSSLFATLSFTEENAIAAFEVSGGWGFVLTLYNCVLVFLFHAACVQLYLQVRKSGWRSLNLAKSVLLFELASNALRLINGINLYDTNRWYHHLVTRIFLTLHIPVSLASSVLIAVYGMEIIWQTSKMKTHFAMLTSAYRYIFYSASAGFALIEVLSIIITLTAPDVLAFLSFPVIGLYTIFNIAVAVLHLVSSVRVLKLMKKSRNPNAQKRQNVIRRFTRTIFIEVCGRLLWTLMLIAQFIIIPIEDNGVFVAASRVTTVIGYIGMSLSSGARIFAFPDNKGRPVNVRTPGTATTNSGVTTDLSSTKTHQNEAPTIVPPDDDSSSSSTLSSGLSASSRPSHNPSLASLSIDMTSVPSSVRSNSSASTSTSGDAVMK